MRREELFSGRFPVASNPIGGGGAETYAGNGQKGAAAGGYSIDFLDPRAARSSFPAFFPSFSVIIPTGEMLLRAAVWHSNVREYFHIFEVLSHGGGIFTEGIPAAVAACMPIAVSSKTRQDSGATPSLDAARRNASGSGLPLA